MRSNRILLGLLILFLNVQSAKALPAFALREKVSCTMCHNNGSAPHLTPYGYMYRRAGFRLPDNIGNKASDDKAMTFQEHMAAGVNLSYEVTSTTTPGASKATINANQINVPEVEVWPLVGAFLGNFAVWSEIDATPSTKGGGGINLSQADLRYAAGNADSFFNFRGGIMAPEGFGASDQWLDDANIPLMDTLAPYYKQDTLVTPFGAMNVPELGLEFGYNYFSSHLTLGVYNGFSGVDSSGNNALTAALTNRTNGVSKDYKVQLDQFIGDVGAVTLAYYNGYMQLKDPSNAFLWANNYNSERAYLTYFALPGVLDVVAGAALTTSQFVTTTPTPMGTFQSRGAFAGLYYYMMPHLTLAGRLDYNIYNTTNDARAQALAGSFQASLPFENNIVILRFNKTGSDLASSGASAGNTNDFRAEWRFLF